ncbi:hypothetical protein [Rufibacter sp. XAAS-G3-1]|uniref:hypothetical protein n=1 Tax=Rufibacter sp. XAAS-G3-1 TaxID=2729134 RepID=UPI0015E6460C|nr:hypothetical protein [Rufibacter sp. XAAS-G3-1]
MITQEQENQIDFSTNQQFRILKDVKKLYHDNKWTEEFDALVNEVKSKIIWDLENLFFLEKYSFNPLKREFKDDSEAGRQQLSIKVKSRFTDFKNAEQNG